MSPLIGSQMRWNKAFVFLLLLALVITGLTWFYEDGPHLASGDGTLVVRHGWPLSYSARYSQNEDYWLGEIPAKWLLATLLPVIKVSWLMFLIDFTFFAAWLVTAYSVIRLALFIFKKAAHLIRRI